VPLMDADGNIQMIRAYGVEEIAIVARTRLPPLAREIFPIIRLSAPWMDTRAGHVGLLIGHDHKQWLPIHVEDSWNPDDDMRLMKSVFGHWYMITDGWGRDLLPPDNAPDGQAGARGGEDEQEEAAQEVQLPEYRGWSQSAGRPGDGDGSSIAAQRGGCLGARPKARGAAPSQLVPSARGRASQGAGRKSPTRNPANLRGLKPDLGLHVLRPQGGRGRDSGWYHLQEGDLLRAHRLLKGGDPGTGLGQFGGVKGPGAPVEEGPCTGHRLRIREELRVRFS
jgi:hypothetical protein